MAARILLGSHSGLTCPETPLRIRSNRASGDQGADPNKLVAITDPLTATAPGAGESFLTVETARFAEILRGVSFTPGTR